MQKEKLEQICQKRKIHTDEHFVLKMVSCIRATPMPTNTMNNKTTQKQQVEQRPLEERQELEKYYNEKADNENQKTDKESSTNTAQHNREATGHSSQ